MDHASDPTWNLQPTDVGRIGSCTKSFTATVVAMLVEQGKLSWNQTLLQTFGFAGMTPQFAQATLHHVLNHRAGFQRDFNPALPSSSGRAGVPTTLGNQRYNFARLLTTTTQPINPLGSYNYR